jgi:hypothetical protein
MALNVHDRPIEKLLLPCSNEYQTSLVRNIAPCIVGLTLAVNLATLYSRVDPRGQPLTFAVNLAISRSTWRSTWLPCSVGFQIVIHYKTMEDDLNT